MSFVYSAADGAKLQGVKNILASKKMRPLLLN